MHSSTVCNRVPSLPHAQLYSEYISRFDKALKTLEDTTKKNLQFAKVLREFEAQPVCAHLPLAGYMLETVQRIPRYKLLLTGGEREWERERGREGERERGEGKREEGKRE